MISITSDGDFSNAISYLDKVTQAVSKSTWIDDYGRKGVAALAAATPIKSGKTASLWNYDVRYTPSGFSLGFFNSNVNKNVNIAIILQYGHGTGTGGYVAGRDYINPAVQPIFDQLASDIIERVRNV